MFVMNNFHFNQLHTLTFHLITTYTILMGFYFSLKHMNKYHINVYI